VREIYNGRVRLALHELAGGDGTPLLLLHRLGGSSRDWGREIDAWPGPVLALDFSGHGASAWRRGGSYHIEHFLSDADVALAAAGISEAVGEALRCRGSRDRRATGVLADIAISEDTPAEERANAAEALWRHAGDSEFRDTDANEVLRFLAGDDDPSVSAIAQDALRDMERYRQRYR